MHIEFDMTTLPYIDNKWLKKLRAQNLWYHRKGHGIRNTHAKYESPISLGKNRCLWNTNAPYPNIENRLDLWLTDLYIYRGHLFINDYLPTKFATSGAKCSWVNSWTRCGRLTWPLTLIFHQLTWISIRIIKSSWTIYLPSLKLLGQSALELSVAQG